MTSEQILQSDMLDILFENRNKAYGAYSLRRNYNSRLIFSVFFSVSSIIILLWLVQPGDKMKSSFSAQEHPEIKITEVVIPYNVLPEIPVPPLPPQPQSTATADFNNIQLVEYVEPESQLLTIREIEHRAISNINTGTITDRFLQSVASPASTVSGIINSSNRNEPAQFFKVEIQPEFPGGIEAWRKFLANNLQVPSEMHPGEIKTVVVKFLVDKDGSVTQFEIDRSGGSEFDREVIRVLKRMPKWKPAVQNGLPVPVTFTQPVSFVGVEQ